MATRAFIGVAGFLVVLAACGSGSSSSGTNQPRSAAALCAVERTAPTAIVKGPAPHLGTPSVARRDFARATRFFDRAAAVAPDAVQHDLETLANALHLVVSRLAVVHYDITKLRPPYTKTLSTPQVRAATTRIEQYLATNCAKKSG